MFEAQLDTEMPSSLKVLSLTPSPQSEADNDVALFKDSSPLDEGDNRPFKYLPHLFWVRCHHHYLHQRFNNKRSDCQSLNNNLIEI